MVVLSAKKIVYSFSYITHFNNYIHKMLFSLERASSYAHMRA